MDTNLETNSNGADEAQRPGANAFVSYGTKHLVEIAWNGKSVDDLLPYRGLVGTSPEAFEQLHKTLDRDSGGCALWGNAGAMGYRVAAIDEAGRLAVVVGNVTTDLTPWMLTMSPAQLRSSLEQGGAGLTALYESQIERDLACDAMMSFCHDGEKGPIVRIDFGGADVNSLMAYEGVLAGLSAARGRVEVVGGNVPEQIKAVFSEWEPTSEVSANDPYGDVFVSAQVLACDRKGQCIQAIWRENNVCEWGSVRIAPLEQLVSEYAERREEIRQERIARLFEWAGLKPDEFEKIENPGISFRIGVYVDDTRRATETLTVEAPELWKLKSSGEIVVGLPDNEPLRPIMPSGNDLYYTDAIIRFDKNENVVSEQFKLVPMTRNGMGPGAAWSPIRDMREQVSAAGQGVTLSMSLSKYLEGEAPQTLLAQAREARARREIERVLDVIGFASTNDLVRLKESIDARLQSDVRPALN